MRVSLSLLMWLLLPLYLFLLPDSSDANPLSTIRVDSLLSATDVEVQEQTTLTCQTTSLPPGSTMRLQHQWVGVGAPTRLGIRRKGTKWVLSSNHPGEWELACCLQKGTFKRCDPVPASLLVQPGLPSRLSLSFPRRQEWVRTWTKVPYVLSVADATGHSTGSPRPTLRLSRLGQASWGAAVWGLGRSKEVIRQVTPKQARLSPKHIVFYEDGVYTLEAKIQAHSPSGQVSLLQTVLLIKVDGTGPTIQLTSPKQGAISRGRQDVLVEGKAFDTASGLASVTLNGHTLPTSPEGRFSLRFPCQWGIQYLFLQAEDHAGNKSAVMRSFLCSPHKESKTAKKRRSAFAVRLSQDALDDQKRASLNDIASILEHIFNQLDRQKLVPKTLAKGRYGLTRWGPFVKYVVARNGRVKLDKATFSLKIEEQGLFLHVGIFGLTLPLRIKAGLVKQTPRVIAPILSFRLRLKVVFEQGVLSLKVLRTSNDASTLRIEGLSGAVGWLRGIIERSVRKRLQSGMAALLENTLFPLLQKTIRSFQIQRSWILPGAHKDAQRRRLLSFSTRFSRIQSRGEHLLVAMRASVGGSGRSSLALPHPTVDIANLSWPQAPFSFAVSINTINQLLASLWSNGLLSHDLSKLLNARLGQRKGLPIEVPKVRAKVECQMPPLLMPGQDAFTFRLAAGGVRLLLGVGEGERAPFMVEAVVHLVMPLRVVPATGGRKMTLLLPSTPEQLAIQIVRLKGLPRLKPVTLSLLLKRLVKELLPSLSTRILRSLPLERWQRLPLPQPLRRWVPSLRVLPRFVLHQGGYVLVGLSLQ